MSRIPKIVTFDRSAAYMHHRAMMNRRDNRVVDALELLRGAVEAQPENSEYRLDLAELLCEMGCHGQSARLLLASGLGNDHLGRHLHDHRFVSLRAQVEGASEKDVLADLKKTARKGSAFGSRKNAAYGGSRRS